MDFAKVLSLKKKSLDLFYQLWNESQNQIR